MFLRVGQSAFVLYIASLLAACGGNGSHREFVGSPNVVAGACPELANQGHDVRSVLTIRNDSVVFVPADGVVELNGHVDASGRMTASRSSGGVDHHAFEMVFEGQLTDGAVVGTFATPRCRASVKMGAI